MFDDFTYVFKRCFFLFCERQKTMFSGEKKTFFEYTKNVVCAASLYAYGKETGVLIVCIALILPSRMLYYIFVERVISIGCPHHREETDIHKNWVEIGPEKKYKFFKTKVQLYSKLRLLPFQSWGLRPGRHFF